MKRRIWKYAVLVLTLTALIASMIPMASAKFLQGQTLTEEELYALVEQATPHPQKTGYLEMDQWLADFFARFEGKDMVQKLKGAYEWIVKNVIYSWWPYTGVHVGYHDFNVDHHLTYDEDLEEVIPYEIVNRAYHAMTTHLGVCYDFAAAYTVMARYLGFNCFSVYGTTDFQIGTDGTPVNRPHGWCVLEIAGQKLLMDPEMDYKLCDDGAGPTSFLNFCVLYDTTWRYTPDPEAVESQANYLPVEAPRHHKVKMDVQASPSGSANTGLKKVWDGEEVTLTAGDEPGFAGWYGPDGLLWCEDRTFTFRAEQDGIYRAVFNGEYFADTEGCWYQENAHRAYGLEIINGKAPFQFCGDDRMNRAMAAEILYRVSGETAEDSKSIFQDVAPDAWYADAVAWGAETGIINGMTEQEFCPDRNISRQDFITMLMRFTDYCGVGAIKTLLNYSDFDEIADYAVEPLEQAQAMGLLGGYEDGTLRPRRDMSRAESVTLLLRLMDCDFWEA